MVTTSSNPICAKYEVPQKLEAAKANGHELTLGQARTLLDRTYFRSTEQLMAVCLISEQGDASDSGRLLRSLVGDFHYSHNWHPVTKYLEIYPNLDAKTAAAYELALKNPKVFHRAHASLADFNAKMTAVDESGLPARPEGMDPIKTKDPIFDMYVHSGGKARGSYFLDLVYDDWFGQPD